MHFFATNAHNFVASTNKLSLIDQTTKRIKEDILAPRYILEPNEHIFVFLDGVLVCDSNSHSLRLGLSKLALRLSLRLSLRLWLWLILWLRLRLWLS